MTKNIVVLPRELTAENGAKGLMMGEFFETIKVHNPEYCGNQCDNCDVMCLDDDVSKIEFFDRKVGVSWTTIKAIHKRVVAGLEVKGG